MSPPPRTRRSRQQGCTRWHYSWSGFRRSKNPSSMVSTVAAEAEGRSPGWLDDGRLRGLSLSHEGDGAYICVLADNLVSSLLRRVCELLSVMPLLRSSGMWCASPTTASRYFHHGLSLAMLSIWLLSFSVNATLGSLARVARSPAIPPSNSRLRSCAVLPRVGSTARCLRYQSTI